MHLIDLISGFQLASVIILLNIKYNFYQSNVHNITYVNIKKYPSHH